MKKSDHLPKTFQSTGAICILFLVLTLLIYGQTILYDFSLDDFLVKDDIPGRREGIDGILHLFASHYNQTDYRPVVLLSFALEKWITGGIHPAVSHVVNLLLYWLSIVCVYKTISLFLKTEEHRLSLLVAVLIFLAHPVHAEVIANLKSRDNLLSFLFTVLSGNFLLRHIYHQKSLKHLFAGVLLFLLALYSKLDSAGLILFIPMLTVVSDPKSIKQSVGYFIGLFLMVVLLRLLLVDILLPVDMSLVSNKGTTFTENPISQDFTIPKGIAAAALTFWYYIKMLLLPIGYRYYYGFDEIRLYNINTWQSILALFSTIILLLITLKYFRKEKIPLISLMGFIVFILYALNIITPVAGIIADRYVFISSFFFCGFIAYLLHTLIKDGKTYVLISGSIILFLMLISFYRTTAWKDQLTLIERDAPYLQKSYEAMRIAASTYIEYADKETDLSKRDELLEKAIKCAEYGNTVYNENVLLHKLEATAYFKKNKLDDARKAFSEALKNDSTDFESYNFLGDIYYLDNNLDKAYDAYLKAFSLNNKDATLITNISSVLYEKGNKAECLTFNKNLLSENDSTFAAWENLGYFYLLEKDTMQAVSYFERGYQYGLQNPEMAGIMSNYLLRNRQKEKAVFFNRYR